MRRLLVAVVGVLAVTAFWAVPAFATPADPSGYIEICKVAGAGIPAGTPFEFTVAHAAQPTVIVRAGECSGAIKVAPPAATMVGDIFNTSVTETGADFYDISHIQQTTNYDGASVSVPVTTESFPVLSGGTIAQETRVDYTNVLVTGFIEVCKAPAPNSGLASGSFTFHITAGASRVITTPLFATDITVPLNQCSAPIAVPAGDVAVTETGTGVFITDVDVVQGGKTTAGNVVDNGVTVPVARSANPGVETLVRFYDALSTLKICKVGGTNDLGTFTGNASFTIAGAAMTSATVAAGAAPGRCVEIGSIIPDSTISIAEAATIGAQVQSIALNGGTTGLTTNLAAGTVSFKALDGANIITYTDVLAPPVLVKVCKAGAAAGATIPLSINGIVATAANNWGFRGTAATLTPSPSILIPAGGGTACTDMLGPFAYGSTVAVTETAPAGTVLTGAVSAGNAAAAVVSGGVASILVGTYGKGTEYIAELTLTNGPAPVVAPIVPPVVVVTPPPSNNTSGGGGGGSVSSETPASPTETPAPTPASATSLTPTPTVVSTPTVTTKLVATKVLTVKQHGLVSRWLGVQLKSNAPVAQVRIQLIGKNGKTISSMIKSVQTGKLVKVLKLGANVKSVKVVPILPSA
jgi:hypothetical protein